MKCLVFSSSTNAYALCQGAYSLGMEVVTTEGYSKFPIPSDPGSTQAEWLLFTEEASLRRALDGQLKGKFLPRSFPDNLLDDKWAFAEWLRDSPGLTEGLRQWPLTEMARAIYPCVLKAKHSWVESVKLPRGWICKTAVEAEKYLEMMLNQGLCSDHFFLQEWLGDADCRVISVCGFHDWQNESRNLTAVVERIASHSKGLSCSAAVETIPDKWQLGFRTEAILNALEFTGPYELEYLVCDRRVVVLEINPRFWMQHAIFLRDGNGLIKRYFDMDDEIDRQQRTIPGVVWIDSLHLVHSIASFHFDFPMMVLQRIFAREKRVIIWPSFPMAIYVWLRIVSNKLRKKWAT